MIRSLHTFLLLTVAAISLRPNRSFVVERQIFGSREQRATDISSSSSGVPITRRYAQKRPRTLEPPPSRPKKPFPEEQLSAVAESLQDINPVAPTAWTKMTSAALNFATRFAPKSYQQPSDRTARVEIQKLPPNSIKLDIADVPIIGKALSGTYVKAQKEPANPAVTITSPRDKLKAAEAAADTGKLEFGLFGLFQSYVDLQLEPNRPGRAPVTLKSPLIPQWPFSKQQSPWNKVTNMGSGEVYYYNERTGQTQTE